MKVLILGGDGYLGWPTAMHLAAHDHDVTIIDGMNKRLWEAQAGVRPLLPSPTMEERCASWLAHGRPISHFVCDISENDRYLQGIISMVHPEAVIHYAEQPSAPFSMMSRQAALETQRNNVLGTLNLMFALRHSAPECHIIKLGTMGEYGTPNIDIEEGWLELEHKGRRDRVLFPKQPGSIYHLSKVHDSHNLEFGARIWGLRVTDLNQGIVYGIWTDEIRASPNTLHTSFHYDSIFGTVLNRFIVQAALRRPLTVYGTGGQIRGFLDIRDTLQCVELALLNPPKAGEFRVFNQFTEVFSIYDLACKVANALGNWMEITSIQNPRVEQENHYYNPICTELPSLGLEPHLLDDGTLRSMYAQVHRYLENVDKNAINPTVEWRQK
jgi:UDP-sulfoquinovose synthase